MPRFASRVVTPSRLMLLFVGDRANSPVGSSLLEVRGFVLGRGFRVWVTARAFSGARPSCVSSRAVVIKASSRKQIDALVADLTAGEGVRREAAVARLTVIGARAVERVVALVESKAPPAARIAGLRALEAIGEPRALGSALRSIDDPDVGVASAAIATARAFLRSPRGNTAVDRLTAAALDRARDAGVRTAAIQALATLEPSTLEPLWRTLVHDPDPDVRAIAHGRAAPPPTAAADALAALTRAADTGVLDDPAALRDRLARAGGELALPLVHRLIERLREQEASEPAAARRAQWAHARAAAHLTLAHRGSRLAVYDLRESLEAADAALPVEFLTALALVGDASCLEPIAAAYGRKDDDWWQQHLADAFRAIVARERITRRQAVVKKIEKRWPTALGDLWAGAAGRPGGSGR